MEGSFITRRTSSYTLADLWRETRRRDGQVVAGIVRVLVPQRTDADQRARVNVDRAAAEEVEFLKADTGRGLGVARMKLLKQSINAHRGMGDVGAATERGMAGARRVRQRGESKVARQRECLT